ncbi:hypothetical protein SAMN06295879_0246 [Agreia bicolorata]|uniref:Uncharacterized protein n=1 Tax=Agreia bicolorata TaxID=110935 RepID=A0A1T4WU33_9MICO|nr:hypothetical protein SAMN06295879_0246 [Agreia bicolorata]
MFGLAVVAIQLVSESSSGVGCIEHRDFDEASCVAIRHQKGVHYIGAATSGEIPNPSAVVASEAHFVKALSMNVQHVDEVRFPPTLGQLVIGCSIPKAISGVVLVTSALSNHPLKLDGRMVRATHAQPPLTATVTAT